MHEILTSFEKYLLDTKKVSANTFRAYTKDCADFLTFLAARGTLWSHVQAADFSDFLASLKKLKISSSAGRRKKTALKSFCLFLHQKYKMPDYRDFLILQASFPLLCDESYIHTTIERLKEKPSFHSLQKAVILSILLTGKVSVKQLLMLTFSDFRPDELRIMVPSGKIALSTDFFWLFDQYRKVLPSKSLLFPIKVGTVIKPLSVSGVWAILKSLVPVPKNRLNIFQVRTKKSVSKSASSLKEMYKKKHPRW